MEALNNNKKQKHTQKQHGSTTTTWQPTHQEVNIQHRLSMLLWDECQSDGYNKHLPLIYTAH